MADAIRMRAAAAPSLRVVSVPEVRPPSGVVEIGGHRVRVLLWGWDEWQASRRSGGAVPGLARPGVCVVEFEPINPSDPDGPAA